MRLTLFLACLWLALVAAAWPRNGAAQSDDTVTLTLTKQAAGAGAEPFELYVGSNNTELETTVVAGESVSVEVEPGAIVWVTEMSSVDWILRDIVCDNAVVIPDLQNGGNSYTVPGEGERYLRMGTSDAACAVVNERVDYVELTLTKRMVGGAEPAEFEVVVSDDIGTDDGVSYGTSVSPEQPAVVRVRPGATVRIREHVGIAWELVSLDCLGAQVLGAPISTHGDFVVEALMGTGSATCQLSNAAVPTIELTITKIVGDGASAERFNMAFDPYVRAPWSRGFVGVPLGHEQSLTYTVPAYSSGFVSEERFPGGIDYGWGLDRFECDGAVAQRSSLQRTLNGGSFEVALGGTDATCTVYNVPRGELSPLDAGPPEPPAPTPVAEVTPTPDSMAPASYPGPIVDVPEIPLGRFSQPLVRSVDQAAEFGLPVAAEMPVSTASPAAAASQIAHTGNTSRSIVGLGLALLGSGAAFTGFARRRRREPASQR